MLGARMLSRAIAPRLPPSAALVLPVSSLLEIAADFEAGRNVIYCFYGTAVESRLLIRVDSVTTIASAAQCGGIGMGVITRIDDRPTMMAMLRGLIESHPEFRVVSAFYKTELIDVDGEIVRAAHALSVLRAPSTSTTAAASRS